MKALSDCILIGLTGQSGAGKTTASNVFIRNGFYVIDADKVSREVTEKGSECNKKLSEYFPECFDLNLTLDRKKLGGIVFSNGDKLSLLNSLIHPFITKRILEIIKIAVSEGFKVVVLDAPTLFESKINELCDVIVSVLSNKELRKERIRSRDNLSDEMIEKRFLSQLDESFFIKNSDFVVYNNSDVYEYENELEKISFEIKEKFLNEKN